MNFGASVGIVDYGWRGFDGAEDRRMVDIGRYCYEKGCRLIGQLVCGVAVARVGSDWVSVPSTEGICEMKFKTLIYILPVIQI